jgi:hypothetical protein
MRLTSHRWQSDTQKEIFQGTWSWIVFRGIVFRVQPINQPESPASLVIKASRYSRS